MWKGKGSAESSIKHLYLLPFLENAETALGFVAAGVNC